MSWEYIALKEAPPIPFSHCPKCQGSPAPEPLCLPTNAYRDMKVVWQDPEPTFKTFKFDRGICYNSMRRLLGLPYMAIFCEDCEDIVGYECPHTFEAEIAKPWIVSLWRKWKLYFGGSGTV